MVQGEGVRQQVLLLDWICGVREEWRMIQTILSRAAERIGSVNKYTLLAGEHMWVGAIYIQLFETLSLRYLLDIGYFIEVGCNV